MTVRTEYEFVLPRGYLDESGNLHKRGTMRLATARDELQPLRDPSVTGPDDPRLTILVLARVVGTLGTLELVTPHEIEGLFAADLAYLQDFYGVVNFGTEEEIDALLAAQDEAAAALNAGAGSASGAAASESAPASPQPSFGAQQASEAGERASAPEGPVSPSLSEPRPARRGAIEEVPSTGR